MLKRGPLFQKPLQYLFWDCSCSVGKDSLIPISNGPVIIHPEQVNQPIEILLEQVRKETFQWLTPKYSQLWKEELTEKESEIYKLKNILSHAIARLQIPLFAAANSLVQMGLTNINITNICKKRHWFQVQQAHLCCNLYCPKAGTKNRINVWSCGPNNPTIGSLDFDLYEKPCKLINSRKSMKRQNFMLYLHMSAQYALVIAQFQVQYDQYCPSFSYFAVFFPEPLVEWNKSKIWVTRKILAILCEINVR